jgi:hypothetical protein
MTPESVGHVGHVGRSNTPPSLSLTASQDKYIYILVDDLLPIGSGIGKDTPPVGRSNIVQQIGAIRTTPTNTLWITR